MSITHTYAEGRRRWLGLAPIAIAAMLFTSLPTGMVRADDATTGSLTVSMDVINDHGGTWTAADFTVTVLDPSGTVVDSFAGSDSGVTLSDLAPGTYTITQTGPTEFNTDWSECGGGSLTVSAGATASCNIINDDKMMPLTVHVDTINDNGGTATDDDFALFVGDTPFVHGIEQSLYIGTYQITIDGPSGYAPVFTGDCDETGEVTLAGTGYDTHFSCTITMNDIPGMLTVVKTVVNDAGGTAVASDATIDVTGTNVTDSEFAGDEAGVTVSMDAGAYSVSEVAMDGYEASYSDDCTGTMAIGESKTCTITNNDVGSPPTTGTITINKVVVNDDGGTATADDFSYMLGGAPVDLGVAYELAAGTYAVAESGDMLSDYAASFSGDCDADGDIVLAAGEDLTCTITNNDIGVAPPTTGTITLQKVVVNDDGGTATADDFTYMLGGAEVDLGVAYTADAGTYAVAESGDMMAQYEATFSGDCDADGLVTLAAGENLTCTITNNDIASAPTTGTITINKVVVNDDGGTAAAEDFAFTLGGAPVDLGVAYELAAGTYAVAESGDMLADYQASFSGDCDADGLVTLAAGQDLTCTITNNDIAPAPTTGTITVNKVMMNEGGGTSTADDFAFTVGGTAVTLGEAVTFDPGVYVIAESGDTLDQYDASFSGDCDEDGELTLAAGEDLTCTITNTFIVPVEETGTITVVKTVVNDDDGEGVVSDFPLFVDGVEVTSSVAHTFAAGTYQVTESNADGYEASFTGDCDEDGFIQLEAGENLTCVMVNNDVEQEEDTNQNSGGGDVDVNVTVNTGDVNVTTGDVNVTTGDVVSDNDVTITTPAVVTPAPLVLGETSVIPPTTTPTTPPAPTGIGVLGETSTLPRTGGFPVEPVALMAGLTLFWGMTRRR